jgi:ribonuclease HI
MMLSQKLKINSIDIWSDGACSGNPGPGGYAAYINYGDVVIAVCGSEDYTTNNRMELSGFLAGLKEAKHIDSKSHITVYTDSKYISNAINCGWLSKWIKKGFSGVKNIDLWQEIVPLLNELDVTVMWVKGHSTSHGNSLADKIACEARDGIHGKQSVIYFYP